ncbi:MAG: hypothetical protein K0B81_04720 [Candidatus Cloacimonetes bacterium]|nr:hypothetical protein [Candidatus Cloacimonadota bacterium]
MKKTILLIILMIPLLSYANTYRVGDHDLLLMPTAYTMPQHDSYFTVYEVFFLNYVYGITNSTHLGAFTLFPIVKEAFETITIGAKQNYLSTDYLESALFTSYTFKTSTYSLGNVFSLSKNRGNSLHVALMFFVPEKDITGQFVVMGGYRFDPSDKISLIVEYANMTRLFEEDFNGLISFGVRFRSTNMSWELGGIRPLEDTGDFIMFPLLKATYHFH